MQAIWYIDCIIVMYVFQNKAFDRSPRSLRTRGLPVVRHVVARPNQAQAKQSTYDQLSCQVSFKHSAE